MFTGIISEIPGWTPGWGIFFLFFLSGGVVSILDNSMEIGSGDSHDNEIVIDLFSKCHIVKKTITKDLFCHIV